MSSGATTSAGRQKKAWGIAGKSWEGVVAMGVASAVGSDLHPDDGSPGMGDNGAITPRPPNAMSEEQLKAFLEAVKADAGLQEQLKAAAEADVVVAIAKVAGFVISVEDLQRAQAELSEEELEGVAGGANSGQMMICVSNVYCGGEQLPLKAPF
jgi:predicted ribosomally synthesized peptide with nif11-like leader